MMREILWSQYDVNWADGGPRSQQMEISTDREHFRGDQGPDGEQVLSVSVESRKVPIWLKQGKPRAIVRSKSGNSANHGRP